MYDKFFDVRIDEINAAFIQPETVEKDLVLRELCQNIGSFAITWFGTVTYTINIHYTPHTYINRVCYS